MTFASRLVQMAANCGTAEQQVPFDVICLADAVTTSDAASALMLAGDGWKLRDCFTPGELSEHLTPIPQWSALSSSKRSSCSQQRVALTVPAFTLSVFA
jgi:hypothetical protein